MPKSPLININDDIIETGYLAQIKQEHFADDVPVTYCDENNPEFLITEYSDGKIRRKQRPDTGKRT